MSLNTKPRAMPITAEEWMNYAKRLTAANAMGIYIQQQDGHRWIIFDRDSEMMPEQLAALLRQDYLKEYGSFNAALDTLDRWLNDAGLTNLLQRFEQNVDYNDDLSNIFGKGVQ